MTTEDEDLDRIDERLRAARATLEYARSGEERARARARIDELLDRRLLLLASR